MCACVCGVMIQGRGQSGRARAHRPENHRRTIVEQRLASDDHRERRGRAERVQNRDDGDTSAAGGHGGHDGAASTRFLMCLKARADALEGAIRSLYDKHNTLSRLVRPLGKSAYTSTARLESCHLRASPPSLITSPPRPRTRLQTSGSTRSARFATTTTICWRG